MSINNILNKPLTVKEIFFNGKFYQFNPTSIQIDYQNNVYTVSGAYGNHKFSIDFEIKGFSIQEAPNPRFTMTELIKSDEESEIMSCLVDPFRQGKIIFTGKNEVVFEATRTENFVMIFSKETSVGKIKCTF